MLIFLFKKDFGIWTNNFSGVCLYVMVMDFRGEEGRGLNFQNFKIFPHSAV